MARLFIISTLVALSAAVGWLFVTLSNAEKRDALIYHNFNIDPKLNTARLSTEEGHKCTRLEVIYARGSLEPAPIGYLLGGRFRQALLPLVDARETVFVGLDYRATFELPGSIDEGIARLVDRIRKRSEECPDLQFALAGYSQGADVIRYSINELAPYAERINSIAVFGDPFTSVGYPDYYAPLVLSLCGPGDRGCGGDGVLGHFTYGSEKLNNLTVEAAKWVATRVEQDVRVESGKKQFDNLPQKGDGGGFLLPWKTWPPVGWKKKYARNNMAVKVVGGKKDT